MGSTKSKRRDQGQQPERPTRIVDSEFSKIIRERDGWTCVRCHQDFNERKNELTCSHFVNVRFSSCRYYADNCISLCWDCHTNPAYGWEFQKGHDYRKFMIQRLGKQRFAKLMELKETQMDLSFAKIEFYTKRRKGILI